MTVFPLAPASYRDTHVIIVTTINKNILHLVNRNELIVLPLTGLVVCGMMRIPMGMGMGVRVRVMGAGMVG